MIPSIMAFFQYAGGLLPGGCLGELSKPLDAGLPTEPDFKTSY